MAPLPQATVQGQQFERTPKLWRGALAERQGKVDSIKQLRLITAVKTPYLPDGRVDLFAYDNLVEQQIAAGVEGLVVGASGSRWRFTPRSLRPQAAPLARGT